MNDGPILVAGAGAAGFAAALSASETECEVVIAERSPHFRVGSNSAMSTAMIPAGGSHWQDSLGIEDSPAQFLHDMERATEGTLDLRIASALTQAAPKLVAWLASDCGVPLELVEDFNYPGHSANRCHTVPDRSGRTLLGYLADAVSKRPNVTLIAPLELTEVTESSTGLMARLARPDGSFDIEEFSAIILATNGFGNNPQLVEKYIPTMGSAYYHGGDGSRGDALRIGASLGVDISYLDAFQGHGSLAMPHAILLTWAAMVHGGIILNSAGRRFGDESSSYSGFAEKTLAQKDGIGWAIFDARIGELCKAFGDYRDLDSVNGIRQANSVEDLAELIGIDPSVVAEQLDFVAACRLGEKSDPFGRVDFGGGIAPPYLAVRITGALFHTQGGLVIDDFARVQRAGSSIPGLYAVGGAAVGVSGHGASGYLAGNGLLAALGLGFIAGHHAGNLVVQ